MYKMQQIKETDQFFLNVDANHIFEMDKQLYYQLIYYPADTILYFDSIVNEIFKETV